MLRPIEPIESDLNSRFLRDRIKLADSGNVIEKHDYDLDAAREVSGLAPYLECWERHSQRGQLPKLDSFDAIRGKIGISGVHLVDTPGTEFQNFRFVSFDSTTRVNGDDLSGTFVAQYPDSSLREAARLDYTASVATGEGRLTVLDVNRVERSGKFARLVLPLSEVNAKGTSKLLVVVQLLEHCPMTAKRVGRAPPVEEDNGNGVATGTYGDRLGNADGAEAGQSGRTKFFGRSARRDEIVMRYFQSGIHEELDDSDLLEWLLRNFLVPSNSRKLTDVLISEFGSLPAVLAMGRERLDDFPGLTTRALLSLKVVRELSTRLIKAETMSGQMVSDARQVVDYCRARMAHETVEHLRILYLDQKNRLIRDETFRGGGVSSVIVNPRQIVKRAILLDAQSIILAHNHPSGDPSPSAADVEVTRDVKRAAEAVEIRLLDHLIVGRSGSVSLRTLGYFDEH